MTTKTLINTYATETGAKRAATQRKIPHPVLEPTDNGRIALYSVIKSVRAQKTTGPVADFRKIFDEHYGLKTWSDIIKLAVEAGIQENTAKTYYYKLKKEHEEKVAEEAARAGENGNGNSEAA